MRLIIVRHGETEENKKGIIQGHLPGHLSEFGKEQARKLAERLKQEKFDYIFSSDLDRARHTAEEIAKFHPKVPFEIKEDLREKNWGDLQGKRKEDLGNWNELKVDENKLRKLNVESIEGLQARSSNFLKNILTKRGKTILLVSHERLIKSILSNILNKPLNEIEDRKNASVTIFELDENGKLTMKIHNCTKHLE